MGVCYSDHDIMDGVNAYLVCYKYPLSHLIWNVKCTASFTRKKVITLVFFLSFFLSLLPSWFVYLSVYFSYQINWWERKYCSACHLKVSWCLSATLLHSSLCFITCLCHSFTLILAQTENLISESVCLFVVLFFKWSNFSVYLSKKWMSWYLW